METTDKKPKILLIDDTEIVRMFFQDIFWIHGLANKYNLKTVENIQLAEALIDYPETTPDIIFLDLAMPMLVNGSKVTNPEAGFNFLKKLKENPKTKHIKVIMYSGFSEKKIKDKAIALGADGYLVKGENMPQELVAFIENIK